MASSKFIQEIQKTAPLPPVSTFSLKSTLLLSSVSSLPVFSTYFSSTVSSHIPHYIAVILFPFEFFFFSLQLIIHNAERSAHIIPVLASSHWVEIIFRISFKMDIIAYKAQHDKAPEYVVKLAKNCSVLHGVCDHFKKLPNYLTN